MKKKVIVASLLVAFSLLGVCVAEENDTLNIVEIATSSEDFETLVVAINTAGLAETLTGDGPFTVFAPTDSAFEALPERTLEALLNNTDALSEILLYHVASEKLMAADVVNLTEIPTLLEGENLTVNSTDAGVMIEDANVVQPDIEASNGVIHAIDAVLIPPFEEETAEEGPETEQICVSDTTRELLLSLNISRFGPESLTTCPSETLEIDPTCLSKTPCT